MILARSILLRILNESEACFVRKNVNDKDGWSHLARKEEGIRYLGMLPNRVYRNCLCLFSHDDGESYLLNSDIEGSKFEDSA